jgi:DNA polymerase I-like protein with 3'-5' exonuclease and polymerase domains
MSKVYPQIRPFYELRYSLNKLKLNDLQVGQDGRNRALLSPFGSKTGRNQPSSSKFVFGNATWLRFFIRPPPGTAMSYNDYSQQEIAIAAALSGDPVLRADYESGDPYARFAHSAGKLPAVYNPDDKAQKAIRNVFKTLMLGVGYGMRVESFARKAGIPEVQAEEIFYAHRGRYHVYWDRIEGVIDNGQLTGHVSTVGDWTCDTLGIGLPKGMSVTSLQNYPMQATGSEILRVAVILAVENNIRVVAPVHDALLIEAPEEYIDRHALVTQKLMAEAGKIVIRYPLRSDIKIIRHPGRYEDERGEDMWKQVWNILGRSPD